MAYSQDDLLNSLDSTQVEENYSTATFKALQLVTLQTTKMPAKKEFYFVVSHRFGTVKDGLDSFFRELEDKNYKIQNRVMLSRYRGKTDCPDCKGTRLRKDANYVKINKTAIAELVLMPIDQLSIFFKKLK